MQRPNVIAHDPLDSDATLTTSLLVRRNRVVTEEKLRLLLDEQHESEGLDYKSTCDLRERREVVEFAKDVGAMQVSGGFIVVGANDRGVPTGGLTPEQAQLLDEATLRAKLDRYIAEPFDIRAASTVWRARS